MFYGFSPLGGADTEDYNNIKILTQLAAVFVFVFFPPSYLNSFIQGSLNADTGFKKQHLTCHHLNKVKTVGFNYSLHKNIMFN